MKSNIVFAIGTGRCGTTFLAKVLQNEPDIASCHERSPLSDTFHRYFKWNQLPIDHEGFLKHKEGYIHEDLKKAKISFEASAYLSLSIEELYKYFNAKFILLVRSPEKVINSYLNKSWYKHKVVRNDHDLPVSYQETDHFHHFMGRIVPNGPFFQEWNEYSRIGKLAWFWNVLNKRVIEQFENIPDSHKRIVKIEDFDYAGYEEIIKFMGTHTQVDRSTYEKIRSSKPNTRKDNKFYLYQWKEEDITQFKEMVSEMSDYFGYSNNITNLIDKESQVENDDKSADNTSLLKKIRNKLKGI
ncbi:MAG: sulfotransferase domain-containing protein [Cyclobacteriaceae bacterium]|nr:sulfotransferase domain-containing protein [Cyclobacteriaceae bacterium SS2]